MDRQQIIRYLAILEAAIRHIKERLASEDRTSEGSIPESAEPDTADRAEPWYIEGAGRFADDPVFDEIMRLGREYRQSLHPGRDDDYCI